MTIQKPKRNKGRPRIYNEGELHPLRYRVPEIISGKIASSISKSGLSINEEIMTRLETYYSLGFGREFSKEELLTVEDTLEKFNEYSKGRVKTYVGETPADLEARFQTDNLDISQEQQAGPTTSTLLRLKKGLIADIKSSAKFFDRSINAEINDRLMKSFEGFQYNHEIEEKIRILRFFTILSERYVRMSKESMVEYIDSITSSYQEKE